MRSPWTGKLIGRYYDELPHWVVDYGCYAVTIRCTGSLPGKTAETLRERWAHLRKIPPNSEAALRERRELFHTMDAALDCGKGFAPFNHTEVAAFFFEWLGAYQEDGLRLAAYLVMPNHLHLISAPLDSASVEEFQLAWRRFKARAGRALNVRMQRRGMF